MKMKKFLNPLAILFSLAAITTLVLPLFSQYIVGGESYNMVIKCYNLVEFSPLGSVVLISPILLIGLILSKLKNSFKTVGTMGLLLLDLLALSHSYSAAYNWIIAEAGSHPQVHMNQLFYLLFLFAACICFFVKCNYFPKDNTLAEAKINVKPIDYHTEKFYLCGKPYNFAKYNQNGETTYSECPICLVSSDGYFIALNDKDNAEYSDVEALENDKAVAFVMEDVSSGIYGRFYDSKKSLIDYDSVINVCVFSEIKSGGGILRITNKDGSSHYSNVEILANSPYDIRITSTENAKDRYPVGSAVMQDEKVVAFITNYDTERGEYKCISAELMASDLCRKLYEHKVFIALQEIKRNRKSKKNK